MQNERQAHTDIKRDVKTRTGRVAGKLSGSHALEVVTNEVLRRRDHAEEPAAFGIVGTLQAEGRRKRRRCLVRLSRYKYISSSGSVCLSVCLPPSLSLSHSLTTDLSDLPA